MVEFLAFPIGRFRCVGEIRKRECEIWIYLAVRGSGERKNNLSRATAGRRVHGGLAITFDWQFLPTTATATASPQRLPWVEKNTAQNVMSIRLKKLNQHQRG